jgi:hypothetical protein
MNDARLRELLCVLIEPNIFEFLDDRLTYHIVDQSLVMNYEILNEPDLNDDNDFKFLTDILQDLNIQNEENLHERIVSSFKETGSRFDVNIFSDEIA